MKAQKFFGLVLALALLATLSGAIVTSASATYQEAAPLPPITPTVSARDATGDRSPTEVSATTRPANSQAQQAIIIDHTCTDLSKIPDYWLEKAKELTLHYAHTSHGSQINSGIDALEEQNSKYDFSIFYAGSTPPTSLSCEAGTLCIYDGNPPETYIQPDDYWSTESGKNRTRAVADTGLFDFSMWSWCGQQSGNSPETTQEYLDTLDEFEQEYPDMRFVYMTGHLDGTGSTGNLHERNEQVRNYCIANNKVLFDFTDIERYDPDGKDYLDLGADDECDYDGGNWADEWCAAHPGECSSCSCAHSRSLNCDLKARAFWWMMARLAGWDGTDGTSESASQKTASTGTPEHGQTVTYTVVVQDLTAPLTATVHLTDVVPVELSYLQGTLTATMGTVTATNAPILQWSGVLSPTPAVTVTYAVTVSVTESQVITNTAFVAAQGYQTISSTATIIANGYSVYLPLVLKDDTP